MTTLIIQSTGRPPKRRPEVPGFSLLDARQIERLADLPSALECTATYLALAVSTDSENVISRGGRKSVQNYTGLSRGAADRAIQTLQEAAIIERLDVENIRNPTAARFALYPAGISATEGVSHMFAVPNSFSFAKHGTSPLAKLVGQRDFGPLSLALDLMRQEADIETECIPSKQFYLPLSDLGHEDLGHVRLRHFDAIEVELAIQDTRNPNARNNLALLEALGVVEWVIYASKSEKDGDEPLTSFPLGVLRCGTPALDVPEAQIGLLSHLLSRLRAGTPPSDLDDLRTNWRKAKSFTLVAPGPSKVGGAIGLLRMCHQVDPKGLRANERRSRCSRIAEDISDVVAEFFPEAMELADAVLKAK